MSNTAVAPSAALDTALGLAGIFTLHPGCFPSIAGQRPVLGAGLLPRLLQNLEASAIAQRLGCLFYLCGHAHRLAATLAVQAALATPPGGATQNAARVEYLRYQTVREHLQRMALDWPVQFGALLEQDGFVTPSLAWTKVPLWQETTASNADSLETLYQCLQTLGILDKAGQADGQWREYLEALQQSLRPLLPLAQVRPVQIEHIAQVAEALADKPAFAYYPQIQGTPYETGAWARVDSKPANIDAGTRVYARWLEVEALLAGTRQLHFGTGRAGAGVYAYVEMSRGLLLHWLLWDAEKNRVADYRVLAPTEWNFHPHGVLAQALSNWSTGDPQRGAQTVLAAAYALDPCTAVHMQKKQAPVAVHVPQALE